MSPSPPAPLGHCSLFPQCHAMGPKAPPGCIGWIYLKGLRKGSLGGCRNLTFGSAPWTDFVPGGAASRAVFVQHHKGKQRILRCFSKGALEKALPHGARQHREEEAATPTLPWLWAMGMCSSWLLPTADSVQRHFPRKNGAFMSRPLPRKGLTGCLGAGYGQTKRGLLWWELGCWQHLLCVRGPPQWLAFCIIAAEGPIILRC